jgi:hypothetical protein
VTTTTGFLFFAIFRTRRSGLFNRARPHCTATGRDRNPTNFLSDGRDNTKL